MPEIPEARLAEIEANAAASDTDQLICEDDDIYAGEVVALVAAARREAGLREALEKIATPVFSWTSQDNERMLRIAREALAAKGTP